MVESIPLIFVSRCQPLAVIYLVETNELDAFVAVSWEW